MPDFASIAAALANAGGWAVAVGMGIALGVAFVKGWIVPRFAYDREVQRGDKLELAATRNAEALDRLTNSIDAIVSGSVKARDA